MINNYELTKSFILEYLLKNKIFYNKNKYIINWGIGDYYIFLKSNNINPTMEIIKEMSNNIKEILNSYDIKIYKSKLDCLFVIDSKLVNAFIESISLNENKYNVLIKKINTFTEEL